MKAILIIAFLMTTSQIAHAADSLQKSTLGFKVRAQLPSSTVDKQSESQDGPEPESLDQSVVQAFLRNDCAQIALLVPSSQYKNVNARILSLAAACEPEGKDPDKMFLRARELDPKDESILLLQARYRSQKLIATAGDLWRQLAKTTTDDRVREMAELYLRGENNEADEILIHRKTEVNGFIQVGGIYESNPSLVSDSNIPFTPVRPSYGATSSGLLRVTKDQPYGTYGFDYFFSDTTYSNNHESDLFAQEIGAPLVINATHDASVVLRPYVNQTLLGRTSYLGDLGVSAARRDGFDGLNQAITVSAYYEHYFQDEDHPQQGTHVKLEWGFHPRRSPILDIDVALFIDHASAGQDVSYRDLVVPYSNFTYTASVGISTKGKFIVGLNGILSYRYDDNDTLVTDSNEKTVSSKKRIDRTVQIQPFVAYTFGSQNTWQGILGYQYSGVRSTMSASDYLDRNSSDQAITISLRKYFEN